MNKSIWQLFLPVVALLITGCVSQTNPEITKDEILNHIEYLASDSLEGRLPGTTGGLLAAQYIKKQFEANQLEAFTQDGFQRFDIVTKCSLGESNYLIINTDTLAISSEFMPLAFSANTAADGELIFAGYGFDIDSDSLQWNDYLNLDVKGKWVLLLRDDPEPDNMTSEFIPFAGDRAKVTLAKDKGAVGVLLVNGVNSSKKDKTLELNYDQNISDAGIPVISITRKVANSILLSAIEDYESRIIENGEAEAKLRSTIIKAKTEIVQEVSTSQNVVYQLKAKQESDQYIIIGGHYDHLGMGGSGVSSRVPDTIAVHNGADDNASGIAGLIELAGFLENKQNNLKKNILFVAFDAEEMGLLGSKHFINNWSEEDGKIVSMLNFDMIGRMKHDTVGITIGGTGTALEFDSLLAIKQASFNISKLPDGYGPSDHAPFYSEKIPVLFFSTGAHSDYHTPKDDIEFIKADKEKAILDYAALLILNMASNSDTLTFQSTGGPQGNQRRTRLKVTLGIVPDFSGIVKDGLGIDGVRPGGPAEAGGLKKGDKITSINGDAVTNIYDYMFRLSKLKVGTTAIVEIERKGDIEIKLIQL